MRGKQNDLYTTLFLCFLRARLYCM